MGTGTDIGLSEYEGGKAEGRLHSPERDDGLSRECRCVGDARGCSRFRSLLLRPGRAGNTKLGKIRGPKLNGRIQYPLTETIRERIFTTR